MSVSVASPRPAMTSKLYKSVEFVKVFCIDKYVVSFDIFFCIFLSIGASNVELKANFAENPFAKL